MLACARIGNISFELNSLLSTQYWYFAAGAIHSVVFGGFAAEQLAVRIDDVKPKACLNMFGHLSYLIP
jgi:hypothetical protein